MSDKIIKVSWHDAGCIIYTETHMLCVPLSLGRMLTDFAVLLGKRGVTKHYAGNGLRWQRR